MKNSNLENVIKDCISREFETEWFEFKTNWFDVDGIGEYISALSNAAAMCGKNKGFLIWGIDDKSHAIVGTSFQYQIEIKNEPYQHYLARNLSKPCFTFEELTINVL